MSDAVTVRMYNVGFGDAFLLLFPGPERQHKVLIDCGTHFGGQGPRPVRNIARHIIRDVTDLDGTPRIDLLVATHRHQDHVKGFESRADWDAVSVGEVWLPWTEDPDDAEATRIREAQSRSARHLRALLLALGATGATTDLAANSLTNAEAMDTLHHGFRDKPRRRFLPTPDSEPQSLTIDGLPGVTIHILGPSRDETTIRDMDPPSEESFLRFGQDGGSAAVQRGPLAQDWAIAAADFATITDYAHLHLSGPDREALERGADAADLAVALDKSVNGTSLMLVFEIGQGCLLFPGDAQWGTWRAALEVPKWQRLLQRTTFLKVGHHGSHNATPRTLVEQTLGNDFWAMISTTHVDEFPRIPKPELVSALEAKARGVARSDLTDGTPEGFVRLDDVYTEVHIPI
jgi:beta-lactamase superfamily II metal-dependent hydrolase